MVWFLLLLLLTLYYTTAYARIVLVLTTYYFQFPHSSVTQSIGRVATLDHLMSYPSWRMFGILLEKTNGQFLLRDNAHTRKLFLKVNYQVLKHENADSQEILKFPKI